MAGMVEYKTPQQIAHEAGFVAAGSDGAPMPARAPVEPPARPVISGNEMAMSVLASLLRTNTSPAAAIAGMAPQILNAAMPTRSAQAAAVPSAAPAAAAVVAPQAGMVGPPTAEEYLRSLPLVAAPYGGENRWGFATTPDVPYELQSSPALREAQQKTTSTFPDRAYPLATGAETAAEVQRLQAGYLRNNQGAGMVAPKAPINATPTAPAPLAPWYERIGLVPASKPAVVNRGGVRG